jgi:hypothetical protein
VGNSKEPIDHNQRQGFKQQATKFNTVTMKDIHGNNTTTEAADPHVSKTPYTVSHSADLIRQEAPFIPIAQQGSKGYSASPSFTVPDLNGNSQFGDILDANNSTGVPILSGGQDCLYDQNLVLHNSFDILDAEKDGDNGEAISDDKDSLEVLLDMPEAVKDLPKEILNEGVSHGTSTCYKVAATFQDEPIVTVVMPPVTHLKPNDGRLVFLILPSTSSLQDDLAGR